LSPSAKSLPTFAQPDTSNWSTTALALDNEKRSPVYKPGATRHISPIVTHDLTPVSVFLWG